MLKPLLLSNLFCPTRCNPENPPKFTADSTTFNLIPGHKSKPELNLPPVHTSKAFIADVQQDYFYVKHVYGHVVTVNDPGATINLLEPWEKNGCKRKLRAPTPVMSKRFDCHVATNAGYFDVETNECIGNIVSNNEIIQKADSSRVNAGFGITKDGKLAFGYVPHENLENFSQFVNGVIWIVKNGTSNIENALKVETGSSQATGSLRGFADVISARTAIGHNSRGQVVIVQIDGQTYKRGVSLKELASLMINEFDVVNAINLDGGGSSQISFHGALADYPSDTCPNDPDYQCVRPISTVLCVREQKTCFDGQKNYGCKNAGRCENGKCICGKNWSGDFCGVPDCGMFNCTVNGVCDVQNLPNFETNHGNTHRNHDFPPVCKCKPGWHGIECIKPCSNSTFGANCLNNCECEATSSICNSETGKCFCKIGVYGDRCDKKCEEGTFGIDCRMRCGCKNEKCDAETGFCEADEIFDFQPVQVISVFSLFLRFCLVSSSVSILTNVLSF